MTDAAPPTPMPPPSATPPTSPASAAGQHIVSRIQRFATWLFGQTKQTIVAAVIAGIISLVVTLMTNYFQAQEAASQAHSSHQLQAMQNLQNVATVQFNTAMAIYRFQSNCAGHFNTWVSCASQAPQMSTFGSLNAAFATAASNVADQSSQQLAAQFDYSCTHMFDAPSAAEGNVRMTQVVDAYLKLNAHLGWLIQWRTE